MAWSKIYVERLDLDDEERQRLREEVAQGRTLAHDNIIRMLKVWVGEEDLTVNFVTELFTSGNLRQFRKKHKDLELKTLRKFGRQILGGLQVRAGTGGGCLGRRGGGGGGGWWRWWRCVRVEQG